MKSQMQIYGLQTLLCLTNLYFSTTLRVRCLRTYHVLPSQFHPDLTEHRLNFFGHLFREVREQTLELHDPFGGDSEWSLGCRVYSRTCGRIADLAAEQEWLSIVDPTNRFIFQIGEVPVRFYRGESDEPGSRTRNVCFPELRQQRIAFPNDVQPLIWRFAIETDEAALAKSVFFLGMTESGEVRCLYEADQGNSNIHQMNQPKTGPGVELPKPTLQVRQDDVSGQDDFE